MSHFKPQPGQIDFTHARFAPVVNTVLCRGREILLVQRSRELNFYPGYWNGISGFLDDQQSFEDKVRSEIHEELGIPMTAVGEIILADIFHQESPKYQKTWIVHAAVAKLVKEQINIKLDWEGQAYAWVDIDKAGEYQLLPGFADVLTAARPFIVLGE